MGTHLPHLRRKPMRVQGKGNSLLILLKKPKWSVPQIAARNYRAGGENYDLSIGR